MFSFVVVVTAFKVYDVLVQITLALIFKKSSDFLNNIIICITTRLSCKIVKYITINLNNRCFVVLMLK